MKRYELEWSVGCSEDPSKAPERFVPARVPGAAQLDWARAEGWPSYWQDNHPERYAWMEGVYWIYESRLRLPRLEEGERVFFVCGGVDYRFLVRVGDRTLHGQEGMFRPVEIDLTDLAQDGELLQVVVFPIPNSGEGPGRSEANASVKPAVGYGWDFQPRLVPSGIWRDAYLESRPRSYIKELTIDYTLEEDLSIARLDLCFELNAGFGGSLEWALVHPSGDMIDGHSIRLDGQSVVDCASEVFDPDLWWPHSHGEPTLYTLTVSLHDDEGGLLDSRSQSIGFRRVRLVMNEGAWLREQEMPASRSLPPMTLEINGRRIFAKGSNWVPPDIFAGVCDESVYRPLLEKAKGAHFDLLRVWGGGGIGRPSFYALCDQLGILVWQEFPLACNCYSESPEYLDTLNQEAVSIIRQLKPHACLAIWCGGNELFNHWSGMTDQHKALRLLNKACFEHDPDTPFLPTSPVMGVGHGGYLFCDAKGRECMEVFQKARGTAYVEFGVPGPASVDLLRSIMAEPDLFPPRADGPWKTRHGFGAWEADAETWLCLPTVERYFGRPESIEELVEWGQLLQAEGYKAIFEEARRQKPFCSMALNWCFNEPWPTAANNSLISWPCEPKPAYRAVKQSCRPTLASARVRKFAWREGEIFEAELWVLNDALKSVKGDRIEAHLRLDDEETFVLGWYFDSLDPDENRMGPVLRYRLPRIDSQTFRLMLRVEGRPDWNSEYAFCFQDGKLGAV